MKGDKESKSQGVGKIRELIQEKRARTFYQVIVIPVQLVWQIITLKIFKRKTMLNPQGTFTSIMTNPSSSLKSPSQTSVKAQPVQTIVHTQLSNNKPNGQSIFLTHEQKIQATYNFQHLFRKKSQLYNINKNKKKGMGKNKGKEVAGMDHQDKESKCVKKGHWNHEENKKYHWFLELNNKKFIFKHLRRFDKIFKAMSTFIGSRQAEQCRSHHQKMQKKFKHFYQIILKLRVEFYGSCNTDAVKADLEENGYTIESKDLLVQEDIIKEMENTKDLQQSGKEEEGNEEKDVLDANQEGDEGEQDQENSQCNKKEKGGAHMLLGENYEQEFSYKLY